MKFFCTMYRSGFSTFALATLLASLTSSCGKKSSSDTSDTYGKVTVSMANNTASGVTAVVKPDTLKIRIMYFLVGNFNEDTKSWAGGAGFKVYYYPTCVTTTTSGTGSNDSFVTSYSTTLGDADCLAKMKADSSSGYIDLAAGTTAVNAALNAQKSQVIAGTYTHFELGLIGSQQGGNNTYENMSWTHSSVTGTQTYALKKTEYIQKFSTPLTLNDGDSVTATIGYDLSTAITTATAAASGDNSQCVTDNTSNKTQTCVAMPTLTFSVAASTK